MEMLQSIWFNNALKE